jgi:RimJ/RimL family protein N-acetyltransferase
MNILETQRLVLRHPVLKDLDDLFAFYSEPDVVIYIQMDGRGKASA